MSQQKDEGSVVDMGRNDLLRLRKVINRDLEADPEQEFAREARVGDGLSGKYFFLKEKKGW